MPQENLKIYIKEGCARQLIGTDSLCVLYFLKGSSSELNSADAPRATCDDARDILMMLVKFEDPGDILGRR